MNHDVDGLGANVAFGHVEIAAVAVALCAPRVLGDVVFCAVLILHDACDVHEVVVGGDERLIALLTDLLSDIDLWTWSFELECFLLKLLWCHVLEAGTICA